MKIKAVSLSLFALVFSMFLFVSCGESKADKKEEAKEEIKKETAEHTAYQCPMDCEEGKTYAEAGNCPVCKMDLKATHKAGDHAEAKKCAMHEGGECSCDADKCKCKNCKEHS